MPLEPWSIREEALRSQLRAALEQDGPIPAILESCARALAAQVDGAAAAVWLPDADGAHLVRAGSAERVGLDHPVIGAVFRDGWPIVTGEATRWSAYPLLSSARVMGVVALESGQPLPEDLLGRLSWVADLLGLWLENRRSVDACREVTAELERAVALKDREIAERARAERCLAAQCACADALARVRTLEEAAPAVLEALCRLLGWDGGALFQVDDAHGVKLVEVHGDVAAAVRARTLLAPGTTARAALDAAAPVWSEGALAFPIAAPHVPRLVVELVRKAPAEADELQLATVASVAARVADFLERRFLTEQLTQSQKLQAVGQLASGVAHDFNNILTVITGNALLAAQDTTDSDPRKEQLDEIIDAAERGADLVRQLMTFGRRTRFDPVRVDLNGIIHSVRNMLRRLIRANIEIAVVVPPNPSMIFADPRQIEQIVINLIVNARDAMPHGGRLEIAVCPGDRTVALCVSDTGVGMSAEVRSKVFEPFFTTKADGKGTGLGLATVAGLVEQLNGTIAVDSTPGAGTRFTITMPRA